MSIDEVEQQMGFNTTLTHSQEVPTPHPDCESLTYAELQDALHRADESLQWVHTIGDAANPVLATWYVQERRMILAELNRRTAHENGTQPAVHTAEGEVTEQIDLSIAGSPGEPAVVNLKDIEEEQIEWLWNDRIARRKITLVDGDPGIGKSWLSEYLAARLTTGEVLPGAESANAPINVLILAEDNAADTIRPRLRAMGGDLSRIYILKGKWTFDGGVQEWNLEDIDTLRKAIQQHQIELVILDPLLSYLAKADNNKARDVRTILTPLANAAADLNCAIVAIRHLNKDALKSALYRGQGSMDFVAVARSALMVIRHPTIPEDKVVCHIKNNHGPLTPSFTYSVVDSDDKIGRFKLGGDYDLSADEILNAWGGDTKPKESKVEIAKGIAIGVLSFGAMPKDEVVRIGQQWGVQARTMERAARAIGIKPDAKRMWTLPEETGGDERM